MSSPAMPDPQVQSADPSAAAAPAPADTSNVPPPVAAPAKPALWKGILQGALEGLAGGKGATSFGGGVAGGAAGVMAAHQQQAENDLQQKASARADKQLQITSQFQSAQAAQAVAQAKVNSARAASLPQESRDAHDAAQVGLLEHMQALGLSPVSVSDDTHDGAVSALNQLGQTQGSIPHLFNLEVGGKHVAFDLNQLSGTPQGLTIINNMREATGQPALTAQQWAQTPKAAQTQASEGALKFFAPPAPANAQQAQGNYLQYKSTLDAYNKKPNPNPDVVKGLTDLTSKLKTVADGMKSSDRGDKAADAYANARAQKEGRTDADKEYYQNQLSTGDVTGWKPRPGAIMSEQQFNAANTKFSSTRLNAANATEAGYQMFQQAYENRKDAKTGAGSMLALASHMGTTFGTLKGMRQTQDIIHEHQNARGIADKAEVYAKKLTNGEIISDNQWKEFGDLISHARNLAWKNTINEAHSAGIPVTKDMVPADVVPSASQNKHADLGFVPSKGN
jgi:hypothetical protein